MVAPSALDITDHRPYPMAQGHWGMGQRWHDLLFVHWRVEPEQLQVLLPVPLEIDVFDGSAWLGVVPFAMTDVRARGLPGLPAMSNFLELNVRTYARYGEMDGIYFFSLDAESKLAVAVARRLFHLPYFNAHVELGRRAGWIDYQSMRVHRDAEPAHLAMSYHPNGPAMQSRPGTLEHFLVERYRLLANRRDGRISNVEIHHGPWLLQPAEFKVHRNTMMDWLGIPLDRPPDHVRFARFQDVYVWRPRVVSRD